MAVPFSQIKALAEKAWYLRSRNRWINLPVPCRLPYGGWFLAYGDTIGLHVAAYRLAQTPFDEGEWKLVRRALERGGTFIDVGANQGFYTILASRTVGPDGRVIAFEPAPSENRKLVRNLRINRCANATVEASAVGAHGGESSFRYVLGHQGSYSGLGEGANDVTAPHRTITVPQTTLDAYADVHGLRSVDVLKLDIEGGELDALKGAEVLLQTSRPVVLCEVSDQRTRPWGYAASDIVAHLSAQDFAWYTTLADGSLERLDGDAGTENLVAVPREKVRALATQPRP
jgi:FkbM family methyltransferase